MKLIPKDILDAAVVVYRKADKEPVTAIASAILAERKKGEKLADEMYLTGVHDAYALANRTGYKDFAERLLSETNEKARRSGLPQLKVPSC